MIPRRQLGATDLQVSSLCLGGNVFGWTADKDESWAVLDAYAAEGGNFIDTADAYGSWVPTNPPGASEGIIGEWISRRNNRDQIVIATKVGMMPDRKGLTADNIIRCAEESLTRLRTEYIDLYYAHSDDPDVELEETLGAFQTLIDRGLVRHVAASNYSASRLQQALDAGRAAGLASYVALQTHYNLMERALYEGALLDVCEANDLDCIPYYSLASGFLTGKYKVDDTADVSVRAPGARDYFSRDGAAVLETMASIASTHDAPMAAVALAWLAQQPTVLSPIASARTPSQLQQIAQIGAVTLTDEELRELDKVTP